VRRARAEALIRLGESRGQLRVLRPQPRAQLLKAPLRSEPGERHSQDAHAPEQLSRRVIGERERDCAQHRDGQLLQRRGCRQVEQLLQPREREDG
jgi:hypothetical protein